MNEGPEWFAPKRFGYGSGLPVAWQGWALIGGFALVAVVIATKLADRPVQMVAALAPFTIAFMVICACTTQGGWRWRWGNDD